MRHLLWSIALAWALLAPGAEAAGAKAYTVAGRVLDAETGQPIEGAKVTAESAGGDIYICKSGVEPAKGQDCKGNTVPFALPVEVITDASGRFAFTGVPRHEFGLRAQKESYTDPPRESNQRDGGDSAELNVTGDVADLTLKLAFVPKTRLSGTLRDESGAPVMGARIFYRAVHVTPSHRPALTERGSAEAETDKEGAYHFDDLQPGLYFLVAEYPGTSEWGERDAPAARDAVGDRVDYVPLRYPAATAEDPRPLLTLSRGATAKADLRFPGRAVLHHVTGKGVERDAPAEGPHCFRIFVADADGFAAYRFHAFTPMEWGSAPLDKRFEAWLPDGAYRVGVGCQACAMGKPCARYAGAETLRVAGADVKDLAVPFGPDSSEVEIPIAISRAFACQGGADAIECLTSPLDSLYLYRLDDGQSEPNPIDVRVYGDAGLSAKAVVPPGTYGMDIGARHLALKSVTSGTLDLEHAYLTVERGAAPPPIQIVLDRGATLKGRVLQAGKPVAGLLYVVPHPPKLLPYTPPRPDETGGTFQVSGLQPGAYYAFASNRDAGLDFRDPATLESFAAQWRSKIKEITVKHGETPSVDLELIELPKAMEE